MFKNRADGYTNPLQVDFIFKGALVKYVLTFSWKEQVLTFMLL